MKRIILTCGPACQNNEMLQKMATVAAGFRLNVAHLDASSLDSWLSRLVALRGSTGKNFAVILDLQGAKVRIGGFPTVDSLAEHVELFLGEQSDDFQRIPVPCASVFAQTAAGDRLFLNDRRIILKVTEKKSASMLAVVEHNGPLSSGKGLNSPDRVFEMARITDGDKEAILRSRHIENIAYAVSFVADGRESSLYRPLTGNVPLIAKIEQRAAFDHLAAIDAHFDEFWLCRGDLGAEAGFKELGRLQAMFVGAMGKAIKKPAILAGEVLGSMVAFPQPSRAEIVQLYDACNSGFSGLVLSDETACGKQVGAVVDFLQSYFAD